jgi:hypothetical protein
MVDVRFVSIMCSETINKYWHICDLNIFYHISYFFILIYNLNLMYTEGKILYDLYNYIKRYNFLLTIQICSSISIVNQGRLIPSPC